MKARQPAGIPSGMVWSCVCVPAAFEGGRTGACAGATWPMLLSRRKDEKMGKNKFGARLTKVRTAGASLSGSVPKWESA